MDEWVMDNYLGQQIRPGDFCMISDQYGFRGPFIYKRNHHFYRPSQWQLNERILKKKKPTVSFINVGFARRVIKISEQDALYGLLGGNDIDTLNSEISKDILKCIKLMKQMVS